MSTNKQKLGDKSTNSYIVHNSDSQKLVHKPLGVPETLSEDMWGQNYFHNNTMMWFALFTVVTLALTVEKHWSIKLLPYHKGRKGHKNYIVVTIFFTALPLWFKKKKMVSLRNVLDEEIQIMLLNLNPSACLFGILWDEIRKNASSILATYGGAMIAVSRKSTCDYLRCELN